MLPCDGLFCYTKVTTVFLFGGDKQAFWRRECADDKDLHIHRAHCRNGAFCGADPDDPLAAVCSAMGVMGVCGELAEKRRLQNHTGNATFRTDLIDAVFNLTEQQLREGLRYEIYQG